jgi:hypothetical protein
MYDTMMSGNPLYTIADKTVRKVYPHKNVIQ